MVRLYPKLSSDRLDDTRFISTDDIDVDPPLCEPLDELLSSRPQSVNQAKYSNGFVFQRYSKDCPSLPA